MSYFGQCTFDISLSTAASRHGKEDSCSIVLQQLTSFIFVGSLDSISAVLFACGIPDAQQLVDGCICMHQHGSWAWRCSHYRQRLEYLTSYLQEWEGST